MRRLAPCVLFAALAACGGPPLPDSEPFPRDDDGGGGGDFFDPPPDRVPDVPAWPALPDDVPPLGIAFDDVTAAVVYQPWSDVYMPGRFRIGGGWYDVELRQRGDGSQEHPKHSWKIRHPEGVTVEGARTRNFLAEWPDGGYLADPFSYELMAGAGVKAPRARYVTFDVNGEHQGVYVEVQQVDKHFLRANGIDDDANVYRCGLRDCELKLGPLAHYQRDWEKKTNETEPRDDLDRFLWELSRTPEHEFAAWVARTIDLDRFVRFYAVAILISLSGIDDSGSYLVHDRVAGRWHWVPWDLNNAKIVYWRVNPAEWALPSTYDVPTYTLYDRATIGVAAGKEARYGAPTHPPFVVLFQRIWDIPALRNRILDEVERMLDGVFSPAQAFPRIEAQHALIADELTRDPWVSWDHVNRSAQTLEDYVVRRTRFLRERIPLERARGEGGLVINAVSPAGVELYNREDAPRALTGLTVTTNLRERLQAPLPDVSIPARGKLAIPLLVSAEGGEVGIFDAATQMPVDAHYYAPLAGRTYSRIPDGAEAWGWR